MRLGPTPGVGRHSPVKVVIKNRGGECLFLRCRRQGVPDRLPQAEGGAEEGCAGGDQEEAEGGAEEDEGGGIPTNIPWVLRGTRVRPLPP